MVAYSVFMYLHCYLSLPVYQYSMTFYDRFSQVVLPYLGNVLLAMHNIRCKITYRCLPKVRPLGLTNFPNLRPDGKQRQPHSVSVVLVRKQPRLLRLTNGIL